MSDNAGGSMMWLEGMAIYVLGVVTGGVIAGTWAYHVGTLRSMDSFRREIERWSQAGKKEE